MEDIAIVALEKSDFEDQKRSKLIVKFGKLFLP